MTEQPTASLPPAGAPLVFAHANSFPAGTYQVLIAQLEARGHRVYTVDKFGHDAHYPVTDQWPHLVEQLRDCARQVQQRTGQTPYLIGHSLGGLLSLMCAARHPSLARGVVMLDSPVVTGWKARALRLIKRSPALRQRVMPSAVSARRRVHWDSHEHALSHFAAKRKFARWDQRVLHDYLHAGLCPHAQGGVELSFDRHIESHIYDTVPHGLGRLLREHPLQCPVAFIGGTRSRELRQVGLSGLRRLPGLRLRMVEGSHLYPMEQPAQTVQLVCELLDEMRSEAAR